ncbi:DoxX family protein [Nocardia takedensis]|uniref:DoxX family protein n=1 Tax=Nocardia takedensis TaxID=259390 RepID=UPI0002DF13E4|nr:membrane protein [Nocardia takedensis]
MGSPTVDSSAESSAGCLRTLARVWLGVSLVFAGISHLSFAREEFRAQVPEWVPVGEDFVVLASGVVEIGLGAALLFAGARLRPIVGVVAALFFVAVFPGNVGQYVEGVDAFGLDTDAKRLVRLFFQPVLIAIALWSTGGWTWARGRLS